MDLSSLADYDRMSDALTAAPVFVFVFRYENIVNCVLSAVC